MSYFCYDQPDVYGYKCTTSKLIDLLELKRVSKWDESLSSIQNYYCLAKAVQMRFEDLIKGMVINSV